MTDGRSPERSAVERIAAHDRQLGSALLAIIAAARSDGTAVFNDVAIRFRDEFLASLRHEGRDAEREAGRLSLDEVRSYLALSALPRLAQEGVIRLPEHGLESPDAVLRLGAELSAEIQAHPTEITDSLRHTGDAPVEPP